MKFYHSYPLYLGAHLTISSTLKIISAASLAANSAYSFTLRHSVIPNSFMSPISPSLISRPLSVFPLKISPLRFYTSSAESSPALSQMIVGSYLRALEYPSIAKDSFPFVERAISSTAKDMRISELPPPYTTLEFYTVYWRTQRAS